METKRTESTDDTNPIHEQLTLSWAENEAEIANLEARKEQLTGQQDELLKEVKQLNQLAFEVDQLQREVLVAEKKYLTYAENLEEARVDLEMQAGISSVSVFQDATLQEKPESPSKGFSVLVGAMMCVAGSLMIAFLSIQFDDTLISPYSVQRRLGVPVLGTLPRSTSYARVAL